MKAPEGGHEAASLDAAADRFFRFYNAQCISPDEDTLFQFLNALHSLNDRMRAVSVNLFESPSFVGLKALRNLFHHHTELIHSVRIIPAHKAPPLTTDLLVLCLVDRSLVERAANLPRERDPEAVMNAFKWYGTIANIQPAIFNVAVDVFEQINEIGATPSSDAYRDFEASYEYEEEEGHAHRVTGDIWCHASSVDEVLRVLFHQQRTA